METDSKNGKILAFNLKTILGLAATIILLFGLWFTMIKQPSKTLNQYAQDYITNNLEQLPVKMDAKSDSLELGKKYYNQHNYLAAQLIFDAQSGKNAKAL